MTAGRSNHEIGVELQLTPKTVRNYVLSILTTSASAIAPKPSSALGTPGCPSGAADCVGPVDAHQ